MKKTVKVISILLLLCLLVAAFVACNDQEPEAEAPVHIDYVSQLKLDMNSDSLKQEVTIKNHVDGDTVHFYVPTTVVSTGVLKARFLAINTPESTGKIEPYGYKASRFTKETLKSAHSIIIESDDNKWNADSTGDRYLVWVWYKPTADSEYRNLNVEILQNGLAIASNTGQNRYGETAMAALMQAKAELLDVHSGKADPEVYDGAPIQLTLKELRLNIEEYKNKKVAFEGVVIKNQSNTVYIEDYDEETGLYFGIPVYYGFTLTSATGRKFLSVGNRVKIVGTVQYYETGDSWQIADIKYRDMKPDDPENIQLISEGGAPAFASISPDKFCNGTVEIAIETEDSVDTIEVEVAKCMLSSSVSMSNLKITKIYTTSDPSSSSVGAMTFTCEAEDGTTITVRTEVIYAEDGTLLTASDFQGKTISVKGIVDCFKGEYQIKVFSAKDITIVE